MTEHTRFGPAGVPPMFRLLGATMLMFPNFCMKKDWMLSSTKLPAGDQNRR